MRGEAFYTNPRLTALFALFIVILGSVAFSSLARQEDPTLTERWGGVTTFMPGATAARMESMVSERIETVLREVPEIEEISSTSKAGLSKVSIQMYDSVTPDQVDTVWSEIRDTLGEVSATLPVNASDPELNINKPIASTLIMALRWQQDAPPQINLMSRLAETLRLRLANMPGTEIAETWGAAEEELLVALDPYALADASLTVAEIAQRIRSADTKLPSGQLNSISNNLLVDVNDELDTAERIARIPLAVTSSGSTMRVADIATVTKSRKTPADSLALHQGRQVILVNAKMQPGLQIAPWTTTANDIIDSFRSGLPNEIGLDIVYNQNQYTGARMEDLATNLAFALVIVLVILIWFMGLRSAITVGIALPLSAGMVLIGMHFLDIPLHQMSVTGLIISLGLLIDNAIVIVQDYKLRRARGITIQAAISNAVKHLLIPLGASTATTIFAFMPIALAPGGVGDFTGTVGVSVALSVASSFILAMTIIPAIAGFLEEKWATRAESKANTQSRWWHEGYSNPRLTAVYRKAIRAVLHKPSLGIGVACILPFIGFALAPTLTQQFFPPVDRNQFQVQLSLPAHSSLSETQAAVAQAERILRADPRVTNSYWTVGEAAPRVFYNVVSKNERVSSFAAAWVNTTSASDTLEMLPQLQRALSNALPQAEILAIPFEQGPPTDAPIEVRIVGSDLDVLREQAEELRRILASVENVTYTRATLSTAEPKLTFVPRENAAAIAGLSTGELSRRLQSALSGDMAGTVLEGTAELDVRVRLADQYRNDVADLATLPLVTNAGRGVPLDELGSWALVPTATAIDRRQGERLSTVQAYLVPFTLPASVMRDFRAQIEHAGFQLPAGYRLQIGGEAEQSSESMGNILQVFLFFALAMAIVVVLSLNSFRQAAMIGGIALLSFGLALFGVRLFGYPFGYMALIGSLGMMGLAINGGIIVLSALKASQQAMSGDIDATTEVVVDATRHIVSTTATTMGGFVPLIVAGGTFWPPLATAIAGGVGGSAIIALFLVPASFRLFTKSNATQPTSTPLQQAIAPLPPTRAHPTKIRLNSASTG